MAKLRLPLLSLEARGALGESIVFFPWKGINCARKFVIPSNPNTLPQQTQRGYITEIVDDIHLAQAHATNPLNAGDTIAYATYSRTLGKTMTWWNAIVRQAILLRQTTTSWAIFGDGLFTPGPDNMTCHLWQHPRHLGPGNVTAGNWYYGTSPTALNTMVAATVAASSIDDVIGALTTGVKYYFQFRATLAVQFLDARSGIYSGTPT